MSVWQKAIVLLLGATVLAGVMRLARMVAHPVGWDHYQKIPWVVYVHPNVRKLSRAKVLAHEGKLDQARAIIVEALTTAPRSPVTRELRDLLGDINTQIFFSKDNSPRKTEYTVRRGDALSSIARKLNSSADAIMRVNDLDSTRIRIGEILTVPSLNFTITIDLPHQRVVVHDGYGFFTQYPIVSVDSPPSRKPFVSTKVSGKSFWKDGHALRENSHASLQGAPRINLGNRRYVLYGVDEPNGTSGSDITVTGDGSEGGSASKGKNSPPRGIAMLKQDIAELDLLVRKGTPVTIIMDRPPNEGNG